MINFMFKKKIDEIARHAKEDQMQFVVMGCNMNVAAALITRNVINAMADDKNQGTIAEAVGYAIHKFDKETLGKFGITIDTSLYDGTKRRKEIQERS